MTKHFGNPVVAELDEPGFLKTPVKICMTLAMLCQLAWPTQNMKRINASLLI